MVDDETDLLELARTTLKALGYRVMTATDGQQALAILAKDPAVDLLFSDVVMPGGINGYELAEEASLRYPRLKVLLTSGYTANTADTSFRGRFDSILLKKPYTHIDLAHRVRALLNRSHGVRESGKE